MCDVDPEVDTRWKSLKNHVETDGVHYNDKVSPNNLSRGKETEKEREREREIFLEPEKKQCLRATNQVLSMCN